MPKGIYERKSVPERFWSKINVLGDDDCWDYMESLNTYGYGAFHIEGKQIGAHRVAYTLIKGDIPKGKWVCHTCDNPACCNPSHLFIGDVLINNRDCYSKGRHPTLRGEDDPKSKLNNKKVLRIVELYKTGKYSQSQLGRMFGVSRSSILSILRGDNWKEVTGIDKPLNLFKAGYRSQLRRLWEKYWD